MTRSFSSSLPPFPVPTFNETLFNFALPPLPVQVEPRGPTAISPLQVGPPTRHRRDAVSPALSCGTSGRI